MHSYLTVQINARKRLNYAIFFSEAVWQLAAFKVHRFFGVFRYQEHFNVNCTRSKHFLTKQIFFELMSRQRGYKTLGTGEI